MAASGSARPTGGRQPAGGWTAPFRIDAMKLQGDLNGDGQVDLNDWGVLAAGL